MGPNAAAYLTLDHVIESETYATSPKGFKAAFGRRVRIPGGEVAQAKLYDRFEAANVDVGQLVIDLASARERNAVARAVDAVHREYAQGCVAADAEMWRALDALNQARGGESDAAINAHFNAGSGAALDDVPDGQAAANLAYEATKQDIRERGHAAAAPLIDANQQRRAKLLHRRRALLVGGLRGRVLAPMRLDMDLIASKFGVEPTPDE